MKRLKIFGYLLLMVVFITSCEEETTILPQGPEINYDQSDTQPYETFLEYVESGNYLLFNQSNKITNQKEIAREEVPGMQFFDNLEDFPYEFLVLEDFEESTLLPNTGGKFNGPLDESTNNEYFSIGDIQPGVSINTLYEKIDNITVANGLAGGITNYIIANKGDGIVLEFTTNVTTVCLSVLSFFNPDLTIGVKVYGSSGLLSSTTEYGSPTGVFWGVISEEPIVKIILNNNGAYEGIDNLRFGPIIDFDGDGCDDKDDPIVFSDMGLTINIDGCDSGVENKVINYMKNTCGYTMNDMINELEAGSYKKKIKFLREVEKLTKFWLVKGLITPEGKLSIENCAAESSIGD